MPPHPHRPNLHSQLCKKYNWLLKTSNKIWKRVSKRKREKQKKQRWRTFNKTYMQLRSKRTLQLCSTVWSTWQIWLNVMISPLWIWWRTFSISSQLNGILASLWPTSCSTIMRGTSESDIVYKDNSSRQNKENRKLVWSMTFNRRKRPNFRVKLKMQQANCAKCKNR